MKYWHFSLLELLVAVAILFAVVSVATAISIQASATTADSRNEWNHARLMSNACEYYLMCASDNPSLPEGLLPAGYRAECQVAPVQDPDAEQVAGLEPVTYHIRLFADDGTIVETQDIFKLRRVVGVTKEK